MVEKLTCFEVFILDIKNSKEIIFICRIVIHVTLQGSILAVVRSSETTIKSFGRVSKITNSSGGRVSFKEETFIFSPVNELVF